MVDKNKRRLIIGKGSKLTRVFLFFCFVFVFVTNQPKWDINAQYSALKWHNAICSLSNVFINVNAHKNNYFHVSTLSHEKWYTQGVNGIK